MMRNNILLNTALVASFALLGFTGYQNYQARQANNAVQTEMSKKASALATVVSKNAQIVYTVDNSGNFDPNAQKVIENLNDWFTTMTTYTSGKEYSANRAQLQKHIKDQSFFKKYYQADTDSSGNSSVDALSLKSKTSSVHSYLTADGSYLVMVRYFQYHREKDLKYEGSLKPSYGTYLVRANQTQITKITAITDLTMENQS